MENAGRLEPGVGYIYERANGVVYARRMGDPPGQRFEIGKHYDRDELFDNIQEQKLWDEIHRAARTNPALQDALDRVKLVHALIQQDYTVPHHQV